MAENGEQPGVAEGTETEGGNPQAGTGSAPTPGPLSSITPELLELDHVFSVLDHPRRRYLLYALATEREWTLTELATKLAAWEQDSPGEEVDESTRDQVYLSLYHAHVPALVENGVVEFDADTETLTRGTAAEEVFTVLAGAGNSLDAARQRHAEQDYSDEEAGHEQ